MTLPRKGTRKIQVAGQTYRWRLNKIREHGCEDCPKVDANLVVETPEGRVWSTSVGLTTPSVPLESIPCTPADVRQFIEARLRGEIW